MINILDKETQRVKNIEGLINALNRQNEGAARIQKKLGIPQAIEGWILAELMGMEKVQVEALIDEGVISHPKEPKSKGFGNSKLKTECEKIYLEEPGEEPILFFTEYRLTVREATDLLGISENTLYRLAHRFPFMKWESVRETEKGFYAYKGCLRAYRQHLKNKFQMES